MLLQKKALPKKRSNNVVKRYILALEKGKNSLHVVSRGNGWSVKKPYVNRGRNFETKAGAVSYARKKGMGSSNDVIVHYKNGEIQSRF